MGVLRIILTVIYILICIALVILVLMQEGKAAGLGAIHGRKTRQDHDGACGRVHVAGGCFKSDFILRIRKRKALLHECGEGAFLRV